MKRIYAGINEKIYDFFTRHRGKSDILSPFFSIRPDPNGTTPLTSMSTSEILVKLAIFQNYDYAFESISFERDRWGKPRCRYPHNDIFFNVSHSGRWTVCAISEQDVGIDIQKITPLSPGQQFSIAQKIFTDDEQRQFSDLSEHERLHFLFRRFSMKESCAKAVGLGIRLPLNTITLEEHKNYFVWENQETKFYIHEYFPDWGYTAFLCSADKIFANIRYAPSIFESNPLIG